VLYVIDGFSKFLSGSQRSRQSGSLRHTGSREVTILQCAGLLGTVTAPCASGFTVIRSIAKHIAAMTNVTTLKTCFMEDFDAFAGSRAAMVSALQPFGLA